MKNYRFTHSTGCFIKYYVFPDISSQMSCTKWWLLIISSTWVVNPGSLESITLDLIYSWCWCVCVTAGSGWRKHDLTFRSKLIAWIINYWELFLHFVYKGNKSMCQYALLFLLGYPSRLCPLQSGPWGVSILRQHIWCRGTHRKCCYQSESQREAQPEVQCTYFHLQYCRLLSLNIITSIEFRGVVHMGFCPVLFSGWRFGTTSHESSHQKQAECLHECLGNNLWTFRMAQIVSFHWPLTATTSIQHPLTTSLICSQ